MVAHLDGTVRRIDDIGEQHGCQNPLKVGLLTLPLPGDEFLDLPAQLGHIALEESVSPVRVLDILRAGNLRGHIPADLYRDQPVLQLAQHHGSARNVRENWPDADEGAWL